MRESSWLSHRARIILRDRIERCNIAAVPGPIRYLPPEVIAEIFRCCLPPSCRPDPSIAPLLLCRVCSLWREIAHNTRDLWSQLDFTSQQKPNLRSFLQSSPIPLLCQWLSHSRKSQLSLSFHRSNNNILPELVSTVLLSNASNIRRLEICLPLRISDNPFQSFFALPSHALKSLKFLILAQRLPDTEVTIFRTPPKLTHLSLDNLDFAVQPHEPGNIPMLYPVFPWVQITHLMIGRFIKPNIWLAVLSSCKSLEVGFFSIDMRGDPVNYESNTSSDSEGEDERHVCGQRQIPRVDGPTVLHHLQELDIMVGCGQSFPFQGFHFPALRAFRFHHSHMPYVPAYQQHLADSLPDTFSWKSSLSFISSLEHLNILSLSGRVGSVKEIMVLLRHVPSIDLLDLNIKVNHQALLHALTVVSSAQPTTIPHLRYLNLMLEPDDISSFSRSALIEMARSRLGLVPNVVPNAPSLGSVSLLSNTLRKQHMDLVQSVVDDTNLHVPSNFDVDVGSSRALPWKSRTSPW